MKKQTQGHPSLPQQEGAGAASSKSPEPAKAGKAPAMVVDQFHGRLVPALPAHPQGVKQHLDHELQRTCTAQIPTTTT